MNRWEVTANYDLSRLEQCPAVGTISIAEVRREVFTKEITAALATLRAQDRLGPGRGCGAQGTDGLRDLAQNSGTAQQSLGRAPNQGQGAIRAYNGGISACKKGSCPQTPMYELRGGGLCLDLGADLPPGPYPRVGSTAAEGSEPGVSAVDQEPVPSLEEETRKRKAHEAEVESWSAHWQKLAGKREWDGVIADLEVYRYSGQKLSLIHI